MILGGAVCVCVCVVFVSIVAGCLGYIGLNWGHPLAATEPHGVAADSGRVETRECRLDLRAGAGV